MKTILFYLDDNDYKKLKEKKEKTGLTWRNFLYHIAGLDKK